MAGGGSGIDRYISELTHEIFKLDKKNSYVLFFRDADKSTGYKDYGHKIVVTGIGHYSYAEQTRLPQILNREKLDLVHFPHFNVPLFYRKPFVATIHDLTHTQIPGKKKSRWYKRMAYNIVIAHAVKSARKIIAVSQNTKNEIMEYFKVPSGKIQVIYEGANQNFKMINKRDAFDYVSNRFGIAKPYILYVGVWRRYKNVESLSQAFDRLKEKNPGYQLVLAGESDPFYPEIKDKIMNIKHNADLKVLGRVPDEDLPYLYNAADLFVLPSTSEGFGLTLLEAANCGVPVACSDIPVLREIMGNGAEYFDPKNIENIADVISGILANPHRSEELANLGLSRTKHFSWKKAAEETIKLYSDAVSRVGTPTEASERTTL